MKTADYLLIAGRLLDIQTSRENALRQFRALRKTKDRAFAIARMEAEVEALRQARHIVGAMAALDGGRRSLRSWLDKIEQAAAIPGREPDDNARRP